MTQVAAVSKVYRSHTCDLGQVPRHPLTFLDSLSLTEAWEQMQLNRMLPPFCRSHLGMQDLLLLFCTGEMFATFPATNHAFKGLKINLPKIKA